MLLNNGQASSSSRMQRRVFLLLIVTGILSISAFLLSLQLPDIDEFQIGRDFRPDGLSSRQKLASRGTESPPILDEPELYSLETAPFLNETVIESRERMGAMAVRPGLIFISISSYRDENCIETLTQLFTRCRHCDRIRIGLVDQLHPDDPPCQLPDHLRAQYDAYVRTIRLDWKQARGPTFARYLTSRLWRGEQYLLQIDAHLNFIDEWDRRLLDMVPRMPSSRFVVSHYPVATVGELENVGNPVPFICQVKFDDYMKGLFSQDSGWYQIAEHSNEPQASPFIGAGFLFAPATVLVEVPYDPYLDFLFHGEEFAHSARLWTSGYELVVPLENIASHVYGHRKNNAFVDNPESSQLAEQARDRVRYILGMSSDVPSRTEEIDDLGLGRSRTFAQYLAFTGLDLDNKRIQSHCNDLYDWKTEMWYSAQDPKPAPFQQLVTMLDRWMPASESVQEFVDRVRIAQMPGRIAPSTIFVSMTSYRDGWCESTLTEIFSKCRLCDRVFVGLVDQVKPGSDDRLCLGPEKYRSQIRLIRVDADLAQGPTMARYLASKLYRNEQFYLQIDSHLKFMDGWDIELQDELAQMPTTKAIVTTYPVIDTTDLSDPNMWVPWICDATMHSGLLIQAANSWYNRFNPAVIQANAVPGTSTFLAAGFMFAPAQILADLPFDRHLPFLFHGEELLMSSRLWTKGWDLFVPLRNLVSHLYYTRNHTVYGDQPKANLIKVQSEDRARYIMGLKPDRPAFDSELNEFGLGSERSIDDYWKFVGVDWKLQTVSNRCQQIYDFKKKEWLPRPAD